MIGSLTPVAEPQVCLPVGNDRRSGRRRNGSAPIAADSRGQQVRQRFERRQIDMGPLPSANGRATLPVEHPQRHFEQRTSSPADQAAVGYGNAALSEHLVNGDLLPAPRVELVENPAFGGAVGVRESSCTTTNARTRPSTTSPPTSTLSLGRLPSPSAISTEPVQLLYPDRLDVYSSGKLLNTLTLADMRLRPLRRNQLVSTFQVWLRSKRIEARIP